MHILSAQEMLVAIIIIIITLGEFCLRFIFRDSIELRIIMSGKKHMA